ncbi:E3 ubiquitin-protein ligase RNF12-B-like [Diachasmimorpha longicaudata]|uniref:E3 ubiquitin-protein ligase RNF12-B-like n=1 Tax=Diachasmimorpha longicaudata TaxID=58733 RepID=UPI0030B86B9F
MAMDTSVIARTSYAQLNLSSNSNEPIMNIISGLVALIYLLSCTEATPVTMFLTGNSDAQDGSSLYSGQWNRIARSSLGGDYGGSDYGTSAQGGFEPSTGHLGDSQHDYSQYGQFTHDTQDSNHFSSGGHEDIGGHDFHVDNHIHSVPISEHVEVTKPITVPVYKEIGVPVPHPVKIHIPHPVAVEVPQPYPVIMPVSQPVPIEIIKTVAVPVEKKVPYPVEKHIPFPIEKPVPITIERHIPVPVEKPYPIRIPVYKTIHHHSKSHGH